MGAEAIVPTTPAPGTAAPGTAAATTNAAEIDPPTAIPLDASTDPWEALRSRARNQRRWAGPRWARALAAAGCLALTGGAVTVLVITSHHRSLPPPAPKAPAVSVPPATISAPVLPPAPDPSFVSPVPVVVATSPSVAATTEPPPAAVVPAPRVTYQPKRPTVTTPHAAQPSPTAATGQPPGTAADRAGAGAAPEAPCTAGCPDPTLTRTPTSWSPSSPP